MPPPAGMDHRRPPWPWLEADLSWWMVGIPGQGYRKRRTPRLQSSQPQPSSAYSYCNAHCGTSCGSWRSLQLPVCQTVLPANLFWNAASWSVDAAFVVLRHRHGAVCSSSGGHVFYFWNAAYWSVVVVVVVVVIVVVVVVFLLFVVLLRHRHGVGCSSSGSCAFCW